MKQTMFTIEIRSPESREERRRDKAERFIALITWAILVAGILAAVVGICHYAQQAEEAAKASYEEYTPRESGEISAMLTAAEWGGGQ